MEFREIGMRLNERLDAQEWADIYDKLVRWEIKLEDSNDEGMKEVFMMQNGLNQYDKNTQSTPYFTVTILKGDVIEKTGKIELKKSASLFNLDFYIENKITFKSFNQQIPVWDGRVYEDNNKIIVGGYSDKMNERSVGFIDEKGIFNAKSGLDADIFPILKTPSNELLFDPFKKQLYKISASNGLMQTKSNRSFLPIELYRNNGKLLDDIHYEIVSQNNGSLLILVGTLNGEKIEIARCNTKISKLVQTKEAFRPALITGASQQGNGEMISLTFEGTYSEKVNLIENNLFLDIENKSVSNSKKSSKIRIDGDFQDWRNISGISDVQGDYVSYLFENPDTDLLEFKVTNDEKYIYFYTRVAGAHGRTGEKGRYYWYTYIDVDGNRSTGYPPTRDDNCYFGIDIGDDSEAQFEFINNKFVKTFFGFTGVGTEHEVLKGILKLGPSYYAPKDNNGKKRDFYKMEYVNRKGTRHLTEDYTEGTSEDIIIALSPDGSEVEVRVEMAGFLRDSNGNSLIFKGKKIDIAVGVEGSSNYYNAKDWGADSSGVIYNYLIK